MAHAHTPPTERPTIRRWLLGLSVGMLVTLLALPATGWIVRQAVQLQFGSFVPMPGPDDNARIAATMQDDYPVQLAAAFELPQEQAFAPMHALENRFPDRPSVYANLLRWYTRSRVRVSRPEANEVPGQHLGQSRHSAETDLAEFDRLAEQGEKLDANNAFFPLLRAAGLYEAQRDDEAMAAFERAAAKPAWEDYVADEAEGQQRLRTRLLGHEDAIVEVAQGASILLPHFSSIRSAARMVVHQATQAEQEGRTEDGLRLRMAVARCGALLRVQSRNLIGNAVGIALTREAMVHAGGTEADTSYREPGSPEAQRQVDGFVSYLNRTGHPSDGRWFREEGRAGVEAKSVMRTGAEVGAFGEPFRRLTLVQGAASLVLTNAIWMALLGLIAAAVCRTARVAAGRPLPLIQRRCSGIVLGCAFVLTVYGLTDGARLDMPLILAVPGSVALTLYAAIFRRAVWVKLGLLLLLASGVSAALAFVIPTAAALAVLGLSAAIVVALVFQRHELLPPLGWAVLQVGTITAVTALAIAEIHGPWQLIEWSHLILSDTVTSSNPWWLAAGVIASFLLAPALAAVLFTGFSLAYRIPLTVGLARGFRGAAVPIASLLLLAFGGTVLATSVQEARVHYAFQRMVEHDGKYSAEMIGRQWPGPVR